MQNPRSAIVLVLSSLLLSLISAEIVLRWQGYTPWQPDRDVELRIEAPTTFFRPDELAGFALNAREAIISINGLTFETHHDSIMLSDTSTTLYRSTVRQDNAAPRTVWFLGGSYTYGWGVDDSSPYPSILANSLQLRSYNFAVPAYGTLQSYLQLGQLLELTSDPPDLVVFGHAPFHGVRNIRSRTWMKTLASFNSLGDIVIPVVDVQSVDQLRFVPVRYRPVPFSRYLAISNTLDETINRKTRRGALEVEVLTNIIEEMDALCRAYGTRFAVLNLVSDDQTPDFFSSLSDAEIWFADLPVDLRLEGNTLIPDDSHPSTRAHVAYAEMAMDSVSAWLGRFRE